LIKGVRFDGSWSDPAVFTAALRAAARQGSYTRR
jgi:hypothetical protein